MAAAHGLGDPPARPGRRTVRARRAPGPGGHRDEHERLLARPEARDEQGVPPRLPLLPGEVPADRGRPQGAGPVIGSLQHRVRHQVAEFLRIGERQGDGRGAANGRAGAGGPGGGRGGRGVPGNPRVLGGLRPASCGDGGGGVLRGRVRAGSGGGTAAGSRLVGGRVRGRGRAGVRRPGRCPGVRCPGVRCRGVRRVRRPGGVRCRGLGVRGVPGGAPPPGRGGGRGTRKGFRPGGRGGVLGRRRAAVRLGVRCGVRGRCGAGRGDHRSWVGGRRKGGGRKGGGRRGRRGGGPRGRAGGRGRVLRWVRGVLQGLGRRGEAVVQGVGRGRGAGVPGGAVVQLPPPVVLVAGGPSPLLTHAPNCPLWEADENEASGKTPPGGPTPHGRPPDGPEATRIRVMIRTAGTVPSDAPRATAGPVRPVLGHWRGIPRSRRPHRSAGHRCFPAPPCQSDGGYGDDVPGRVCAVAVFRHDGPTAERPSGDPQGEDSG
ncbi:hypothetical protein STXM2123_4516 [Streptomyces sp. F-3]|nr:hypothetical protein STXM2123_4516 [Streptomyces sp. F-3]